MRWINDRAAVLVKPMDPLYRFIDVRREGSDRLYTFTLCSGETRLLQFVDKAEKDVIMDWAVGKVICDEGTIEIVSGDRRRAKVVASSQQERRRRNDPVPLIWHSLQVSRSGRVGWVAGNGGLISNLKIWENVTLPLWYHAKRDAVETEQKVEYWLMQLGMEQPAFADFMAALPHTVEPWQRKLAGLLRALVQMPRVLIVDAGVFEDVKARFAQSWISALGLYASQGRAVLVLADKAMVLPWEKTE